MRITDKNILDAALKVFSTEGYAGATTRKIAQEANVTEVTLFRKFQSKENLLKEVLNKNRNSILPIKRSLKINKDADIERDLCFFGNEISKNMEEEQKDSTKHMFMLMLFEEGRRRPELANILISIFQNDIEQISEYFEQQIKYGNARSINARSAALTFVSYFGCVAFLKGIFVDSDFDYKVEDFIDIFTKGILKVEETKGVLGKAEKLQKLKEDIARKKEDLNHLSEQIQELEKD